MLPSSGKRLQLHTEFHYSDRFKPLTTATQDKHHWYRKEKEKNCITRRHSSFSYVFILHIACFKLLCNIIIQMFDSAACISRLKPESVDFSGVITVSANADMQPRPGRNEHIDRLLV